MTMLEFTDIDLVIEDLETRAKDLDEMEASDVLGGRGYRLRRSRGRSRRRRYLARRSRRSSKDKRGRPRGRSSRSSPRRRRTRASLASRAKFHDRKAAGYRAQMARM